MFSDGVPNWRSAAARRYRLLLLPAGISTGLYPQAWMNRNEQPTPVVEGVLGQVDTSGLGWVYAPAVYGGPTRPARDEAVCKLPG